MAVPQRQRRPLRIVQTRPQCGCTATVLDDDAVPPGGNGTMKVTFDPIGLDGTVRKSLAVITDDERNPRILWALLAEIIPVAVQRKEGEHERIAGQSMLIGECATCHGEDGAGVHAPSIRDPSYLAGRTDEELHQAVAYGSTNPGMPGFLDLMGGPLDTAQVDSLVTLMRSWDPGSDPPTH